MYREGELAAVAARENNNKRKYLVVNRLQGKHIPVSPSEFFSMTNELADMVWQAYNGERVLLVGFAETATAIGASLAVRLDMGYIQTTRENIEGVSWLYFTESHSHATEQRLVRDDIEGVIGETDRIVFIEDEVTTGNTILKIIDIIDREFGGRVKFSVASLLNGMDEGSLAVYNKRNIGIHYLVKTDHSGYTAIAEGYAKDGEYVPKNTEEPLIKVRETIVTGILNARRYIDGAEYDYACDRICEAAAADINGREILVLGTEEFMYPALYLARRLEAAGNTVKCHSTTRSPIAVSREQDYPLHTRYELASLYDDERTTYIYDLKKYDTVFIVTDAENSSEAGINSLANALHLQGNNDIRLIKCRT